MNKARYATLAQFRDAVASGKHPDATIVVDNDDVYAFDENTDEHLWFGPGGGSPRDALHEALALLGLKSMDC